MRYLDTQPGPDGNRQHNPHADPNCHTYADALDHGDGHTDTLGYTGAGANRDGYTRAR
jgi:hypothetical protein